MDEFKKECDHLIDEVMNCLEILNGTEYSEVANDVRIMLTNKVNDLKTFVEVKEIAKEGGGVKTYVIDGKRVKICYMSAIVEGQGVGAVGGIGVSWGEKVDFNMGMQVQTNEVNRMTTELWGILVAMSIAEARKYKSILIVTDEVTYTNRLVKMIKDNTIKEKVGSEVLVNKLVELCNKVEICVPNDAEVAGIRSCQERMKKISLKHATEAVKEAKKNK